MTDLATLHWQRKTLDTASPAVQSSLDRCTEEDVPILKLLRQACPPGMHGFGCDTRWDVHDSFLPRPRRWVRQFNASRARAAMPDGVDCQRGFFDAFGAALTRMHWEQEWDAQPFRISATPPRTIGKMLHQLITANYYHLTLGPEKRPKLRSAPAPGHHYKPLPQPGFRWNVLDYGGGMQEEIDYKRLVTMPGNVLSRPLSAGRRCKGVRAAWHCLWQRFPAQSDPRPAPAPTSPLGRAAGALYNLSLAGERPGGLVQYLVATGVTAVFTQPTPQVRSYLSEHLRGLCHRYGPYCGGGAEEARTPVAAVHVRHGDACDRRVETPGPWNNMFAWDEKLGKLTREAAGGRRCYSWAVYRQQLLELQRLYGVRTVLLSTDDHTGGVLKGLQREKGFNWVYLDYPREQFRKRAWMEFRSDLDENAPFSLAAELELLGEADLFVGNMGSHTSRLIYLKLVAAAKTAVLPPFISVDGYGLCCGFTEECTKPIIKRRARKIRGCIYSYGLATGGEQFFYHRG